MPASMSSVCVCQHISDWTLNLSVSFKALGRPCLSCWLDMPCQVVADLPLLHLLQLLWSALASGKLCRRLCTVEAHFGCGDSLRLKHSN